MIDGSGSDARFLAPLGIAVDLAGNIFVSEFASDVIRKVTPDGTTSTLAGSIGIPGGENGQGDNAHFRNPWSVAVDCFSNVYVADESNFAIRQITPDGRVSTFAGRIGATGHSDGPGGYARFSNPHGVAVDSTAASPVVYVADTGNGVVRAIDRSGVVRTLAGTANALGIADGTGSKARFSNVQSVAVGELGNIYVLDGDAIRKITPAGAVTTLAVDSFTDDQGKSIHPTSLAVDRTGDLYLVEALKNVIWKATPPKVPAAQKP